MWEIRIWSYILIVDIIVYMSRYFFEFLVWLIEFFVIVSIVFIVKYVVGKKFYCDVKYIVWDNFVKKFCFYDYYII